MRNRPPAGDKSLDTTPLPLPLPPEVVKELELDLAPLRCVRDNGGPPAVPSSLPCLFLPRPLAPPLLPPLQPPLPPPLPLPAPPAPPLPLLLQPPSLLLPLLRVAK